MVKQSISWWSKDVGKQPPCEITTSFENRCISQGAMTEELEKELAKFLGTPYVVLTTSGSTALLMALIAIGIKPGDEVIVPNLTFITTAQAPLLLGAKVKLVDVQHDRPVIDPEKIEEAVTSCTKAIIPVHLNGLSADMQKINKIAGKHNLKVIEDAAEALCSKNRFGCLGTQSHFGVFSLSMTKLVSSGQGGFLTTNSKKSFKLLQKIRNYGMASNPSKSIRYDVFGFNFKFSDILAGVGLSQLRRTEHDRNRMVSIYRYYKKGLKDLRFIKLIEIDEGIGEFPLWVSALCEERDKTIALLKRKNIQAIPFDPCLSEAPYLTSKRNFPCSKVYSKNGLILPCGPGQKIKAIQLTIRELRNIRDLI